MLSRSRLLTCLCLALAALFVSSSYAEEPAPPAASAEEAAAPEIAVLAHSPILDGVLENDQWTAVRSYSLDGATLSISAAWDSGRLYLAVESPQAPALLVFLDAEADGWRAGANNYEIKIVPGAPAAVTARRYNALLPSDKSGPQLPTVLLGARAVSKTTDGRMLTEIEVPAGQTRGLVFADGARLAVGASTLGPGPGPVAPEDPASSVTAITLKDEIAPTAVDGLKLDIRIKDRRVVPGQTLSLDFHADNVGAEPFAYRHFTIGGEPRVADLLNFLRVRGGTLQPGKGLKWGFSTDLPETMPLGTFSVAAEFALEDGRTARVLSSFEVVEPVEASLDAGNGPIAPGGERKLYVTIRNNCNRPINGLVSLSVPEQLAPGLSRNSAKYLVRSENSETRVEFRLKHPGAIPPGEYPVGAEVRTGPHIRALNGAILIGAGQ